MLKAQHSDLVAQAASLQAEQESLHVRFIKVTSQLDSLTEAAAQKELELSGSRAEVAAGAAALIEVRAEAADRHGTYYCKGPQ